MNPQEVANQFLNAYYQNMQNNRANLLNMYNDNSFMSYNRSEHRGIK